MASPETYEYAGLRDHLHCLLSNFPEKSQSSELLSKMMHDIAMTLMFKMFTCNNHRHENS